MNGDHAVQVQVEWDTASGYVLFLAVLSKEA